jgi:hypothetical protein
MVHNVLSPEVQLSAYILLLYNLKVRQVYILVARFHAYILSECESDRWISDCSNDSYWLCSTYWLLDDRMAP